MKHNFEISYTQQGDYLLPDLRLPEQPWDWNMGQTAFTLHQAAPQNPLYQSADELQAHRLSRRHWWAGRGDFLSVSKTTCRKGGCDRTSQSGKSNALGEAYEQYPQPSGRNRKCRVDLYLISTAAKRDNSCLAAFSKIFQKALDNYIGRWYSYYSIRYIDKRYNIRWYIGKR